MGFGDTVAARFATYVEGLAGVIGHKGARNLTLRHDQNSLSHVGALSRRHRQNPAEAEPALAGEKASRSGLVRDHHACSV